MIVKNFPSSKFLNNSKGPCDEFGWPNMILNAKTKKSFYENITGSLSIKTTISGSEFYKTGKAISHVNENKYLVLNSGQEYSTWIDSPKKEVESFSLIFRPTFASDVLHSIITPNDKLLDNPFDKTQPLMFVDKTYYGDDVLTPILNLMHQKTNSGIIIEEELDELFHIAIQKLLITHRNILPELNKINSLKASTRAELYRRLYKAKDHIDANIFKYLSVDEMSKTAMLSPHHFLRCFKMLFGITPYQYILSMKIEKAADLIKNTKLDITEICSMLAFESFPTFSLTFKKRIGCSPSDFRKISNI